MGRKRNKRFPVKVELRQGSLSSLKNVFAKGLVREVNDGVGRRRVAMRVGGVRHEMN